MKEDTIDDIIGKFEGLDPQPGTVVSDEEFNIYQDDCTTFIILNYKTVLEALKSHRDNQTRKTGDYFMYTNSNALGLVRFVGVDQNTGGIVVTNEASPDKHLRTVAGWEHLKPVFEKSEENK